MRPLFIVLEALDGVGKTTLALGLAKRLGGVAMNTPGDLLRAVSHSVLEGLGPNQEARCLFYAASVLAEGSKARAAVNRGTTVVMDRYWLSTLAYARARGVGAALHDVEALVPAPDLTLLIVLDEDERQRRLHARGCTTADRETLDAVFRERVLAEMLAERRVGLGPTVVVDVTGMGEVEAVVEAATVIRRAATWS